MTQAGVADAEGKVRAFLTERYPWLRMPAVIEDPFSPDTTVYHVTDMGDYYAILIPRWWDEHRRDLLIHECGHVLAYFCGRHRDVIREWLVAMGGDPKYNDDRMRGEMFAEHFVRAYVPEYNGSSYPQLVGLVPFDAARMRAFCESLKEVEVPQTDYPGAIWVASPNYTLGRVSLSAVVEHWTVSTIGSALNTFASASSQVSPHYAIARDGVIYQCVREANSAWHDSSAGWNAKSIGIEHEHQIGQDWPAAQLAASARLHRDIFARRGQLAAIGHGSTYATFQTECPGDLPIERLLEDYLLAEISETRLREIIREETQPISDKLNPFTENVPWTWLRRAFYGFDPATRVRVPNPTTATPPADLK